MHGGCCELEPGGDASSASHDDYVITPTLPTVALPRRGRRQAVYDPKVDDVTMNSSLNLTVTHQIRVGDNLSLGNGALLPATHTHGLRFFATRKYALFLSVDVSVTIILDDTIYVLTDILSVVYAAGQLHPDKCLTSLSYSSFVQNG